jgi:hypothetical protein
MATRTSLVHDAYMSFPSTAGSEHAADVSPGRTGLAQKFDFARVDWVSERVRVFVKVQSDVHRSHSSDCHCARLPLKEIRQVFEYADLSNYYQPNTVM